MPDESKKNQNKSNKHEAKEQRRPRQRHQAAADKKSDKKAEPRVPVPDKPVYQEPGPEFYKGLKRETDDILKITEEANSKYKKKEIQSNWTKYEMPIGSYEEIEEQENLGADYEKLIEAPLSIGGHFQFKHEKSWDVTIGPSLYDKYFDINMDNLVVALSTIPFYERNGIDKTIFSETDLLNMNNRATRYKQKYNPDNSYTTVELEAQNKILNILKEGLNKEEDIIESSDDLTVIESNKFDLDTTNVIKEITAIRPVSPDEGDIKLNIESTETEECVDRGIKLNKAVEKLTIGETEISEDIDAAVMLENIGENIIRVPEEKPNSVPKEKTLEATEESLPKVVPKASNVEKETRKNPVIESPEDLEKWLDDFLDG